MSSFFNRQIEFPECQDCNGDMWARDEYNEIRQDVNGKDLRCSCYLRNRFLDSNIGFDYWFINPENWKGDESDLNQMVPYFEKNQIENLIDKGTGFYIYGPYGVGKTSLGCMFLTNVIEQTNYSCLFVPFSELVVINSKIMTGWHDKDIERAIEDIKNVDWLILDDLAKEYDNARDNGRATLNAILRYRDLWRKPTIYTANIPLKETADKYGGSSFSIIRGRSIEINMENTEDYRNIRKGE